MKRMKQQFDNFYHNDNLIIPALTNDWTVIPSNKIDHINLYSKKLDQTILIAVNYLVDFLNFNNIQIDSKNRLSSNIVFDKYLNMVLEEDYVYWKNKDDKEKAIENQDLKIGFVYTLEDGLKCVYLGSRFVSELIKDKYIRLDRITDISKKHYVLLHDEVIELTEYVYEDSANKVISKEEAQDILTDFYQTNYSIVYFGDKDVKNPQYGMVNADISSPFIKIGDEYYTKVQNSNNLDTCWLFDEGYKKGALDFEFEVKLDEEFSKGRSIPIKDNKSEEITLVRFGLV